MYLSSSSKRKSKEKVKSYLSIKCTMTFKKEKTKGPKQGKLKRRNNIKKVLSLLDLNKHKFD